VKRVGLVTVAIVFWLIALTAVERPVYAYADPGSGLLLTQILGSAFTAAAFYLRRRVVSFFRKTQR
jgi:hypothetical protein